MGKKAGEALRKRCRGKSPFHVRQRNMIRAFDDMDEALEQLVLDWTAEGLTTPENTAVLCHTNEQVHRANTLCQEQRLRVPDLIDTSVSPHE